MQDLLVYNIGELITLSGPDAPRKGGQMSELGIVRDGAILIENGRIVKAGTEKDILREYGEIKKYDAVNARGKVVTPGFVDPHTHPVFAQTREEEFEMRIKGISYQEIAKAGGGIRNSVRKLRQMTKETLKEKVKSRLDRFLSLGTTTIEAKSGYGLSVEDEIKSLEVLEELSHTHLIDIVPTFLGAHEVPDEYQGNREGYIELLINEMIPKIAGRSLAKYCDIFCEKHVFDIEESRRILTKANAAGLRLKLHADELEPMGGAELAAELKAVSADHLIAVSQQGINAMKEAGVIPVILPATSFFLGLKKHAPARSMIDTGLPVALSTDFNPGSSMTQSMLIVLTLASVNLKMTPAEALTAATINSACAIGMEKEVGSLMPGKKADIIVWDAPNYKYLAYYFGDNIASTVIKRGIVLKGHELSAG